MNILSKMFSSNATLLIPTNATSKEHRMIASIRTAAVVICSIVCLVGITGNSMVTYIFGFKKRFHRTTNELLLLTLGVCDLAASLTLPPLLLYTAIAMHSKTWYVIGCLVTPLMMAVNITKSQVILIIICYDRYRAIVKPLEHKMCKVFLRSGTLLAILLGVVVSVPGLIQFDIEKYEQDICLDFKGNRYKTLLQSLVLIVRDIASLAIMSFFIYKIFGALRAGEAFRGQSTSTKETKSFNRTRRILYAVIIVFISCILPGDILLVVIASRYFGESLTMAQIKVVAALLLFMELLQVFNSSANVFVYSAIHPDFKRIRKRMFGFLLKCRRWKSRDEEVKARANSSSKLQNGDTPIPQEVEMHEQ